MRYFHVKLTDFKHNAIQIVNLADFFRIPKSHLFQGEEFLQLDIDDVTEVLSTRELSCDGLNEEAFCDAALTWLRHTWPNRRKYVYQVYFSLKRKKS